MFKKKSNQDKINNLISYKEDLVKTYNNRKEILESIDNFSAEELRNILIKHYGGKENLSTNDLETLKKKVSKKLNDDLVYNEIWIKETNKKIDKINNK